MLRDRRVRIDRALGAHLRGRRDDGRPGIGEEEGPEQLPALEELFAGDLAQPAKKLDFVDARDLLCRQQASLRLAEVIEDVAEGTERIDANDAA